jgi:hypothetical protein
MDSNRTFLVLRSLGVALSVGLCLSGYASGQSATTIAFSEDGAISLPSVGGVRLGFPSCGPDGTSYSTMMVDPAKSSETRLVSVATDGTVLFYDTGHIPGISGGTVDSVASDSSGAILLVGGVPNKSIPEGLALQGMNQFLVRYDLAGHRLWVHGLPKEFTFPRIASLGQSSLLGLRVDRSTGAFSLAVMNQDGAFLKTIDMGRDLITVSEVKSFIAQLGIGGMENAPPSLQAQSATSLIQMQAVGRSVFLIKSGSIHEIFRIDENGTVSATQLKVPQGADPRSIVPDPDLGLTTVTFGPVGQDSSLLQFDLSTGAATGHVQVSGMSVLSAICKREGKYYGVKMSKTGATLMVGELTKTIP